MIPSFPITAESLAYTFSKKTELASEGAGDDTVDGYATDDGGGTKLVCALVDINDGDNVDDDDNGELVLVVLVSMTSLQVVTAVRMAARSIVSASYRNVRGLFRYINAAPSTHDNTLGMRSLL
jgi:hypothetical protein